MHRIGGWAALALVLGPVSAHAASSLPAPDGGAAAPPGTGAGPTATAPPRAEEASKPSAPEAANGTETDCVFGIAVWCLSSTPRRASLPQTKLRFEGFVGYKFSNLYYRAEQRGCEAAGCTIDFTGPSFAFDGFYNVKGHPHTDDYLDVGLSVSYMPIVSRIRDNAAGFAGEFGRVGAGDGSLAYLPLRVAIRRPSFLFLIKSKYLVSAFGAGLAVPIASGAGETFPGADGLRPTVGGRLGAHVPIGDAVSVGVSTNWSVIWYGGVLDASFQTSYGLDVGYQL